MKKYEKILLLVLTVILIVLVLYRFKIIKEIVSENHYSIATIIKIGSAVSGGPDADFVYCVKSVKYYGFTDLRGRQNTIKVGDKFMVKYKYENPQKGLILIESKIVNISDTMRKYNIDTCSNIK